ncbi:IkappaB kinase complex IKAP component [Obba rivulosa]|uniref:Elongator complex protein 1 n=1 Tax=Obba rivulosa TaxID=1052685 RepID=A0A8E2B1R1_9APHY|nr:IkappaB kinase complex IKAP component [Obba rivulosa]
MRNLSLWRHSSVSIPSSLRSEEGAFSAVAFDLELNATYVAHERCDADADVEIQIWRIAEGLQQELKDESVTIEPTLLTTFSTSASPASNPWASSSSSSTSRPSEIVSMRLLAETRALVLVTCAGDIAITEVDEPAPLVDVVGSVDAGIKAASWGPDDSLLVLVTGDNRLILMTSTFDVLQENPLQNSDFGEDAPIALGWGAKATQFHGSLGKAAAQAGLDLAAVGSSPDDDERPRISWRGDGAFFTVSALAPPSPDLPLRRRILRVYSREGALQSTAEPVAGLEHTLSWRPSGNLIASTQRFGSGPEADKLGLGKGRNGRHDVVFFERNGLRHGEFELREVREGVAVGQWEYKVREIGWSADSNIMSVWVERDKGDLVQLWTMGNYHWYLKQEIYATSGPSNVPGRFTSVIWHPENASEIILTTSSEVIQRTYVWDVFTSLSKPPADSGSVAVVDGANILLTPFRSQNVPPPMASHILTFTLPSPPSPAQAFIPRVPVPVHISFSPLKDFLAVLWESGYIEVWDLQTRLEPGRGPAMAPSQVWMGLANPDGAEIGALSLNYRQIVISASATAESLVSLAVLGSATDGGEHDVVSVIVILPSGTVAQRRRVRTPELHGRLIPAEEGIIWQSSSGEIFTASSTEDLFSPKSRFPEFCYHALHVSVVPDGVDTPSPLFVGFSSGGKLHVVDDEGSARTLTTNVNSFTVASEFLIYTTTAHYSHYAPLSTLASLLKLPATTDLPEWESRRVERGSRIVTAVPSNMALVLQMPRGNLETINPRPLVMKIVRADIDGGNYRKAFLSCRKHRIDLNVLVEHDQEAFLRRIPSFVEQVAEVDYINLFLTSVGQGSLPADLISRVCDGVRLELERRDLKKYVSSILTSHVMKKSADHEAALALLLRLRDSEPELVEDAVKYIIFLVDADSLFNTALGMYDFSLVLMIAQHAQKDPREYLPFLRELRALDHYYQRFRIDDHLRRYEKALTNLSLAGAERFDEAMAYVERHRLYDKALALWQATDRYESVLELYGEWLYERREFKEAAFVFRQAGKLSKAMVAHEKALDWQELFELALQTNTSKEDLESIGYSMADELSSKKRYSDAARVFLDYVKDVRRAVIALVQGNLFSEARRVIALHSCPELLEEIVHPGALESRAQITEDLNEMKEQLRKQVQRLRELHIRKVEEPDAFYGVEDADLHNVDVMTDVSMAPTAFTRYTVAPSTVSRATSKRSSRSKRKMERKIGSGRKGTVDEEEYLLKSVTKLVGRFTSTQADAVSLIPHLLQFTDEHRSEGLSLQDELAAFEKELRQAVEEIWQLPENNVDGRAGDGWAARMQEHEKKRQINPLEKVARPEVKKQDWNLKLPVHGGS